MQMSGGHLLAVGLDDGNSLIFFRQCERKCNRVPFGVPKQNNPNLIAGFGLFLFFGEQHPQR